MNSSGLAFLCLLGFSAWAATPQFRPADVDTKIEIGYGLALADVNGDGKKDILLADKNLIVWYENPGWQKHIMAEKLTALDHVCIAAADIDGDGKAEVAAGAGWNPGDTVGSGALFYLQAPPDRAAKWEPVTLHHEPTVHRIRWVKGEDGKQSLVLIPLHGRGNKGGAGEGVKLLAYQVPADAKQPWKTTLIDDSLHMTHNFNPTQWDNDAAEELLVAAKEGIFLFDPQAGGWKKTQIGGNAPGETAFIGAGEVRNGKLPNGSRYVVSVEPMHGNQVVVYTPSEGKPLWGRQVLEEALIDGHAIACGDFLRAGSDQFIVGWRGRKPGDSIGVKMFVAAAAGAWTTHTIDATGMACEDLAAADLNGDGKLDLVAAGRSTKNVKVYWNESP